MLPVNLVERLPETGKLGVMSTVLVPRSRAEIARDLAAMDRAGKKITRSKETARAWLVKHGFITRGGKLTKRYGG